jgi:hypothetical protein
MTLKESMDDRDSYLAAAAKEDLKPTLNYINFSDRGKLELTLMGDTHIGSRYYDSDLHKEILDYCLERESPIILMGDQLETATKDSIGAGLFEQDEMVQQQLDHFIQLYGPLAEKGLILGIHPGNHEFRLYKHSGLDITKVMAKMLDTKYLGWGKLHYIKVGKQGYTLYTTHGSSGATLPHTKIRSCLKLADLVDAEMYAQGHVHQLSHHVRNFYSTNLRRKTVQEKQKHFLLTGSYLTHWGSYGHMKSYEPMRKGSPKVKLNGKVHRIRVSL